MFTKHCLSLKIHRINDRNLFQPKILFKLSKQHVYFGQPKTYRFSCVCAHGHTIFADTSGCSMVTGYFINVLNFTSPSKIQISGNRTDFQKHIPYKEKRKIHQVHVITCFKRLICPRVKIMFQKTSQRQH